MPDELHELLKIGLTEGEAKVYKALLELGSSTVGPIVKKAKVAYSNIYDILERLMEKGIATYIIKAKTKHFQAASPSNLKLFLEKKERKLKEQKESLTKALPQLKKLQQLAPQQEAEVFIGTKGLRTAYEKLLGGTTKKDEDLFFYIHDPAYAKEAELFYSSIGNIFKKVKTRGIADQSSRKMKFLQQADYINTRYADFPIPGNIEICRDQVLIVAWEKPVITIFIHSKVVADHFRKYLNAVWKLAKP